MISKMFAILEFFLTFHHTKFQLPHFSFSYNGTTHLVFLVAPDGSNCSLSPFPCEVTVQLPEHACSELARWRIILEKTRPPLAFGFFSPTHEAFLAQQQDWHHIDLFWEPVQSINRVLKWAKTLQMAEKIVNQRKFLPQKFIWAGLTLYTLPSKCNFSMLFFRNFLWHLQGEYIKQSIASSVSENLFYPHEWP